MMEAAMDLIRRISPNHTETALFSSPHPPSSTLFRSPLPSRLTARFNAFGVDGGPAAKDFRPKYNRLMNHVNHRLGVHVPGIESLKHNPNGRFVVVCGDGEYIIYTALEWRNRSSGSALEFVWSSDGECAVRESTSRIKLFSKTFQIL